MIADSLALTVEGLSPFEKQVYTYAFGMAGAVQCGFCIPGMVLCAKSLLDRNGTPTREEAAYAIRNNICRCTGYVKIIDAILLAGELLRDNKLTITMVSDCVGFGNYSYFTEQFKKYYGMTPREYQNSVRKT